MLDAYTAFYCRESATALLVFSARRTSSVVNSFSFEEEVRANGLFIADFGEGQTSVAFATCLCCRHEARDIVRHAVGASEQDAVLFTGQGTAAALRTLLRHLDLSKSTVVFVGPFEHHANLRPWRELDVKVSRQPADKFSLEKPGG